MPRWRPRTATTPEALHLRVPAGGRIRRAVAAALAVAFAVALSAAGWIGATRAAEPDASARPPTCAEQFPADGPAGLDLQLGCVVRELTGLYLGSGAADQPARISALGPPLAALATGLAIAWLVVRWVRRRAGARMAAAAPEAWWSCTGCRSLNAAGVLRCYACGRAWDPASLEVRVDPDALADQSFGRDPRA